MNEHRHIDFNNNNIEQQQGDIGMSSHITWIIKLDTLPVAVRHASPLIPQENVEKDSFASLFSFYFCIFSHQIISYLPCEREWETGGQWRSARDVNGKVFFEAFLALWLIRSRAGQTSFADVPHQWSERNSWKKSALNKHSKKSLSLLPDSSN